ncbi:MAG: ComEC/Rec2 family competence protein, partial [Chloroflexota bacterium]|nr:ComEC/Rec2 family competence protein [Chloroflexota bacterium]
GAPLLALGWLVRRGGLAMLGVALLGVALGAWRGETAAGAPPAGMLRVADLVDADEHEILGTVLDDPRPREERLQLVLGEILVAVDGRPAPVADRLLVWLPRGIDARSGDRLLLRSEVELAEDFDGFAYREYLGRQGIGGIARAMSAEVVATASGPASAMAAIRNGLLGGLNDLVPEPEAALGAGILLGVRASIAPEINDAFATAGLTHVVAISGWNIAIVAALVAAVVRPLSRRPGGRWTTAAVSAATVGGYVVLTGASPSVTRAALMAGAMLVVRLGGSRAHASSALAMAALVMLLAAPPVLWDVGFQLSLLATAGLIWFGAPIERRLPAWPGWIREPVALTLAAQLTTLPVILVNFERLSLVAPVANVLVVPFVPVAMLFSAIAAVVGLVDAAVELPVVGSVLTWAAGGAAWLVLRVIVALGTAVASVPNASVAVSVPPVLAVAWLPILALADWAVRDRSGARDARAEPEPGRSAAALRAALRPLPIGAALVMLLLGITLASRPDGRLHITALDIGQGDAILVETPGGTTMLVDGGPDPELTLRRLGANLPFHARRIELLVLSHPHQDHVAGLVDVLDRFRVGAVLHGAIAFDNPAFERLLTDAAGAATPVLTARAGQVMALDATTSIQVLYPSDADASAPLPEGDINNGSVVLLLRHGGFTALLTGDAEAPVEAALVGRDLLAPVDVLKVGHHGSTSSTTAGLLEATRPSVAVISAGEGNEYGHPAPETLTALSSVPGIVILRTDIHGDVEVETDGLTYRVRTDAGWSPSRPVHGSHGAASIHPWPSPTDPPLGACSPTPACPTASSSTPRVSPASPLPRRAWWPRPRSRSTARSSRQRRCSTTSTRSRSAAPAASTASSARGGWRRWATTSSPCRSPPIRSPRCSTTIGSPSAGPRCWSPSPIATSHRSS